MSFLTRYDFDSDSFVVCILYTQAIYLLICSTAFPGVMNDGSWLPSTAAQFNLAHFMHRYRIKARTNYSEIRMLLITVM